MSKITRFLEKLRFSKKVKSHMPEPTDVHYKRDPETGAYEVDMAFVPSEESKIFASVAYQILKQHNAPNFVTFEVTTPEHMRLAITIQRMAWDAKTPSSQLSVLTKENNGLKEKIAKLEGM